MVSQFRRPSLTFFVLSALFGMAVPGRAEDWPVARGASHEPVPFIYDPQQIKKLPRAFLDDTPACTLYSGNSHLVENDGTEELITHEIIRFNGRKGIDKLGEYRNITYDPAYQKLTLHVARVLKADGRRVDIEPKHVQLRDVSTDYQVYDHEKQLIISFPNLEVGDAIEIKSSRRGKNPEYLGHFFECYSFGDERYPVALDEMRVRVPKAIPLKYASFNGKLEPVIREEGNYRLYHWQVTNRREMPQDENLPSKEELRLGVACSTFPSWEAVGKWKQKLRAGCWKCTPTIQKVVREVTQPWKTPQDKARALTYWIRRHIRYVSAGVTHDYKPHPPASVFTNRFGDCKDQAQLLAVMLREAGLQVGLVTLGTEDDGQIVESVPSPWGSHAILLVTIDGKQHWIDTTVSLAPWDYLPRHDRGRLTYVTDDKGLRLLRTPALTAADNRIEQTTLVTVSADGTSHNRRLVVYQGAAALSQREDLSEVPAGERRRQVSSALQDSNSRARLRRLAINEKKLKDLEQPVALAMEFDIPRHFSGSSELEGSLSDSPVWGKLLRYTLDYDRSVPLQLGTPFESIHRYVVRLPVGLRFDSFPKDKSIRSRWGSFQLAALPDRKDPRLFALEFRTRLDKTRIEPADFAQFRQFQEQVNKAWRAWLTFKPTQDLADAPALEARLVLAPNDVASATILARLYCNNNRFDKARQVLAWARFLHPKNQALWELTVRAAATWKDEERAYQEMVRYFPGELQYVVELGATRVKCGDHAGAKAVLEPLTRKGTSAQSAQSAQCGAAHYQLARSALVQDQPARALEHLEAAAKVDPDSVRGSLARIFKGRVYEKLGRTKDALAAYRQALEVNGEAEAALLALIRLELGAGQRGRSLDYLRRYTLLVSGDLQGLVKAANFHFQLGRHEDALDLASRALDIRHDVEAQRIVGLVYAKQGDHERAVQALARAEKTADVREQLIRGYVALGKLQDALKQGQTAQSIAKSPAGLRQACALAVKLNERRETLAKKFPKPENRAEAWEQALDTLVCAEHAHEEGGSQKNVEKLLGVAPGSLAIGPAYSLRGLVQLEKGHLAKALADAERAIRLDACDARAYYVRGRVRFERGREGALTDLGRAAELSGRRNAAILHALAAALWHAHWRQEALAAQKEAVKLRPKDVEIVEQLREFGKSGK